MNNKLVCTAGGALAALLVCWSAAAQDLTLDSRRSLLSGHFIVGYAIEDVTDVFNETWTTNDASFGFTRARSGSIDTEYRGKAIDGLGSYEIAQWYSVGERQIELAGEAHNTLAAVQDYVSAGARATSTAWLDFSIPTAMTFSLAGEIDATPGAPVAGVASVATSTVILEQRSGGSARWAFADPGSFAADGRLTAGDWRLYGSANTRSNGDASFAGTLVLSPVPEPSAWSLALAGLLPLGLRRRRLAAAAAAALAAAPALAQVNTLGQPEYYTTYEVLTRQGPSRFDINSHDEAVNGGVYVVTNTGTMWDGQVANQNAVVVNNGATYWSNAMGPMLLQPSVATTEIGAITTVDVFQSFQKVAADAALRFTYTGGTLQLFRHPEIGGVCGDGCAFAEVVWRVSVTLNSAPEVPVMVETGRAAMGVLGGNFRFYSSIDASDGSPANPLWQWDCTNCDRSARNLATATLDAPYAGIVDLSAVPFDPAQPADFTVHYALKTTAYVTEAFAGAKAWARDPLGGGEDGVALVVEGLLPTNAPVGVVPEPQTWALLLAGAGLIAWRRRGAEPR